MSAKVNSNADAWFVVERWQQFNAECRANLLRIVAIGVFYVIHLLNYYQGELGLFELGRKLDDSYHRSVTVLAVAWTMLAVGVDLCLRNRVFPSHIGSFTTLCDVAFLTAMLCLGECQRSPLVLAYMLIIVLAGLRLDVRLVQVATLASLVGYLFLMAFARWPDFFGAPDDVGQVPRYAQLMTLIGVLLCGVMTGQIVRRVRHMAQELAELAALGDGQELANHE